MAKIIINCRDTLLNKGILIQIKFIKSPFHELLLQIFKYFFKFPFSDIAPRMIFRRRFITIFNWYLMCPFLLHETAEGFFYLSCMLFQCIIFKIYLFDLFCIFGKDIFSIDDFMLLQLFFK